MSDINPWNGSENPLIRNPIVKALRQHSGWFLAEGIALCLLGLAAIGLPLIAGVVVTLILGWVLLIAGVIGLIAVLRTNTAPGFWWAFISAVWSIAIGAMLLFDPVRGLAALTYVLIAYFLIDGILTIMFALSHRRELSGRWEWMLINGIVDIALAAIIILGLPGTILWALGLLVGIDLLFGGASLIAMALHARRPG